MKPIGFEARKAEALDRIKGAVGSARRPVVLSSFGKDSLCLLSLLEYLSVEVDIGYFELGAVKSAHSFARNMIARQKLNVTLLRPHRTFIAKGIGGADLAYSFDLTSRDAFQIVGATFDDTYHTDLACGLQSSLLRSGMHGPYDWDLILTGRRRVDMDPTLGSLDIATDVARLEHGTQILMPLHQWTDEDVAFYLKDQGRYAPDWDRYEVTDGVLQNRADKSANPDHAPICIRCLTRDELGASNCPLSLSCAEEPRALVRREHFRTGNIPATVML